MSDGWLSVLFLTSNCAFVRLFLCMSEEEKKNEYKVKEKPSYSLFLISQRCSLARACQSALHGSGARKHSPSWKDPIQPDRSTGEGKDSTLWSDL